LRTPLTIARGHLELLQRQQGETPDLGAALDALARIERIERIVCSSALPSRRPWTKRSTARSPPEASGYAPPSLMAINPWSTSRGKEAQTMEKSRRWNGMGKPNG
jgi:hypothetical protein